MFSFGSCLVGGGGGGARNKRGKQDQLEGSELTRLITNTA